jgi:hypothetical protein
MHTNSWDKIRQKGGPKVYKTGPRLTGRARLERRLVALLLDFARFVRAEGSREARLRGAPVSPARQRDHAWATEWIAVLQQTQRRLTAEAAEDGHE